MEMHKIERELETITQWPDEKLVMARVALQLEAMGNTHPRQQAQANRLLAHVTFEILSRENDQ